MKYTFPLRNKHHGEILTLPHSWTTDKISIRVIENQNYAIAGFTDIKLYGCGPTFDNTYLPILEDEYDPYPDYPDYTSIRPFETSTTPRDPDDKKYEPLQIKVTV